jgi:hypothetical protein
MRTLSVVLCCAFAGSIACSQRADSPPESCERVRDQLVSLEVKPSDRDRDDRRRVMRRAMGPEFIASCVRTTTKSQRNCVFEASDSRAALACIAEGRSPQQVSNNKRSQ